MAHFDGVGAAHRGRGCLLKYILIFETLYNSLMEATTK